MTTLCVKPLHYVSYILCTYSIVNSHSLPVFPPVGVELMVVRANWTSRVLDPRGCPAGEGVEIGTARLAIIFF